MIAGLLAIGAAAMAPPTDWLSRQFGMSRNELDRLVGGASVALVLPAADPREIALVGAVRIPGTPATYAARLADIATFKRGPQVEAIGVFSQPASLDDLSSLRLTDGEIRALRECRRADCGLQLDEGMLAAIENVSRRRGDRDAYVLAYRQGLLDMVRGYQRQGLPGLATYVDDDHPVDVGQEARHLIAQDTRLLPALPEWRARLDGGSPTRQADVSLVYWSRERIGRASVVSITHLSIGAAPELGPGVMLAASRQLYASHYFDASLGLTTVWPEPEGSTLVYYSRSRVDTFDGFMGGMLRRLVQSRAQKALRQHLTHLARARHHDDEVFGDAR